MKPRLIALASSAAALLASSTTVAVASTTAPVAASIPIPACSWYGETDQRDVNVGAPDLDAHYWADVLAVTPGRSDTVTGTFPFARYFSLHAYDASGSVLSSIYDKQVRPNGHARNPYSGPTNAKHRATYRVTITFAEAPKHPARNTLYVPPEQGPQGRFALLVYRVYVPTNPKSPQGGVPFPRVTQNLASGAVQQNACSTTPPPFGSAAWATAAQTNYPDGAPTPDVAGAKRVPVWLRQFGSSLGNQQNAYLAATISRQYGDLVVIHGKAPTFPDNRKGVPPYHRSQVRYWSFCTYDVNGQAGYGCAADYDAVIRHGHYTYVVSDPAVRPANATAKHGVTWLPWGGTQSSAQVMMRNMLPSPWFRHAAQVIAKPQDNKRAKALMGAYYPRAVYCKPAVFARGGWRACFRRSAGHQAGKAFR